MISGLRSHQRDLVVPAAKQRPDRIQFTLNGTEGKQFNSCSHLDTKALHTGIQDSIKAY